MPRYARQLVDIILTPPRELAPEALAHDDSLVIIKCPHCEWGIAHTDLRRMDAGRYVYFRCDDCDGTVKARVPMHASIDM